ncbi:MAG: SemiSWEET family transporter [Pseudomonadota bacterium]
MLQIQPEAVGMVAAFLSTVSLLPQLWRSWTTRSVRDLSLGWIIIAGVGACLWIVYGLMIGGLSIVVANSLVGLMLVALVAMKLAFEANAAAAKHQ